MILAAFEDLTDGVLHDWMERFRRVGRSPQHGPAYARALADSGARLVVGVDREAVVVGVLGPDRVTLVSSSEPALGEGLFSPGDFGVVLDRLHAETGLPVYAPLLDARFGDLGGQPSVLSWTRSPNSSIDWSERGRDLVERAARRGGSSIQRKRRLVERDGLQLDQGRTGWEAAADMLRVDDRSWKALTGQSMTQRDNQAALYSSLLATGTVSAAFLIDGDVPVAFRLDAPVGDQLTCLKWSYDERYAKYSPGTYLLTVGLVELWSERPLAAVDLCGGPDNLKNLISTHQHPRVDVWYGDSEAALPLKEDRQGLDHRLNEAFSAGRGLRHVFT